ncbi:MAG TPA: hypothetical protein VD908_03795 [Cytophagales bacterium]|nr:hypothetical protein [Cytophagales bacterium]
MKNCKLLFFFLIVFLSHYANCESLNLKLFEADNKYIQYTGRIDFTNSKLPRFWNAGVYITTRFSGSSCEIVINDHKQIAEELTTFLKETMGWGR